MSSNYKSVTIAELIEDFCPINLSKEDYQLVTLKKVSDDYRTKKLFFDPSYQRMYGSWDNNRKRKYIKSIFMKWIYTPIVISELSKEAKNKTPENTKFACLDGQHRTNAIAEFVSNKFGLNCLIEIDGIEKNYNNVLFKDLTPRERSLFLRRTVEVQIIKPNDAETTKSRQTLAKIFLAINDGAPLNAQEKRNAVQCDVSNWSRECYSSYKDCLAPKMYNSRQLNRMVFHEYVIKSYLFLKNFIAIESTEKLRTYIDLNTKSLDDVCVTNYRINNFISRFIKSNLLAVMENILECVEESWSIMNPIAIKRLKQSELWVLTMIYSILFLEEKQQLVDIGENFTSLDFWHFVQETHKSLISESKKHEANLYTKLEDELITIEEYKKHKFFHDEIRTFHLAGSQKICYAKIYEHLGGTVSGSIKSWYTKKMTKIIASA
tara:strand:- start:3189 stop:4493 length:1305 start_codon:yes stop_codon:yes gene_type:complete